MFCGWLPLVRMPAKDAGDSDGLRAYAARFTDIYDGPKLVSGSISLWDFTATLELRERPSSMLGGPRFCPSTSSSRISSTSQ